MNQASSGWHAKKLPPLTGNQHDWLGGVVVEGRVEVLGNAVAIDEGEPAIFKCVSAPVFKSESSDAAEVFGVVGHDGRLMMQSRGSDKNVGDADRRSLVEQSGVEVCSEAGARGIEREDLQEGNQVRDLGAFVFAMFKRRTVRTLEEFKLGDDRNIAITGVAYSQPSNDFFSATQDINADVGVEDAHHCSKCRGRSRDATSSNPLFPVPSPGPDVSSDFEFFLLANPWNILAAEDFEEIPEVFLEILQILPLGPVIWVVV